MISLSNYEEWFILYMDNELNAAQKKTVDDFLLLHPHLQEELDLLLSTKLPAEDFVFTGKEELQAAAMKLNAVDEPLLLYIDNELSAAENKQVEAKIASDKDYRLQYDLLKATRLDASEIIPYPHKKELYRHSEKVIRLRVWMRIAAAVVLLLSGSYFFLDQSSKQPDRTVDVARYTKPVQTEKQTTPVADDNKETIRPTEPADVAKRAPAITPTERKQTKTNLPLPVNEPAPEPSLSTHQSTETASIQQQEAIHVNVEKLTPQPVTALNKTVANLPVTSVAAVTYNQSENPDETAVITGEENPRTPAKGFLRKVARFIERRTGIGTVNADNELLVGAVALKLN